VGHGRIRRWSGGLRGQEPVARVLTAAEAPETLNLYPPVASAAGREATQLGGFCISEASPSSMTGVPSRTYVYVDGFNFYYGAVRGTPHKWCDLGALFGNLLPAHDVLATKYFTARTKPRPNDADVHVRQEVYFRALRTIPNLSIHLGTFRQSVVTARSAGSNPAIPRFVQVHKTEEKGSDVNLASNLLLDCFRGRFDVAAVVSNDTDLVEPIRMVVRELGFPGVLINPHPKPARDLIRASTSYLKIRAGVLAASQFPNPLTDERGTFHKPTSW